MSDYGLEYHPAVYDDLFDIFLFIEAYAGPEVARRKLDEIEEVTRGLTDFPHIGSVRNELAAGLRAVPAAEKAVISFTIDENRLTVRILCISYAGGDWMGRVRKRQE